MGRMVGRKISAFVLSAVIMPVILLASFHQHERPAEGACEECSQHIPHNHFSQNTDNCLVCQFLTISWLTSSAQTHCAPASETDFLKVFAVIGPDEEPVDGISARAPPFFFC